MTDSVRAATLDDVELVWKLGAAEKFHDFSFPEGMDACSLGPSYSVLHQGKPLAVVGYKPLSPWVADCWALVNVTAVKEEPGSVFALHRACKVLLATEGSRFRRLEASVLASDPVFCRWVEALGFEREGLRRGYGPTGEDFWLYARIDQ